MFDRIKAYGTKVAIITGAIGGTLLLGGYAVSAISTTKSSLDNYVQDQARETFEEIKTAASQEVQKNLKSFNRRLDAVQGTVNKQTKATQNTNTKIHDVDKRLKGIEGKIDAVIQLMNK